MKFLTTIILGAILLGSPAMGAGIASAAQQYQAAARTMTRDEVYRELGRPQTTDAKGVQHWWIDDTQGECTELAVTFDPAGHVTNLEYQCLLN